MTPDPTLTGDGASPAWDDLMRRERLMLRDRLSAALEQLRLVEAELAAIAVQLEQGP
jgi:hypothetical protein